MYHPLWKFNIVYLSLMMLGYSQAQETQDHFVGTQLIVSKHHGCLVDGRNGLEFRSCPSRGKSDSDAYWRFIPELIDTNGATYYAIYKATGDECISSVNSKLITAPCHRDDHHLWRIAKRDKVGDAERLYKCIDEHKALLADRRPIVDECDANESNQRFRLVQYDPEKHKDE